MGLIKKPYWKKITDANMNPDGVYILPKAYSVSLSYLTYAGTPSEVNGQQIEEELFPAEFGFKDGFTTDLTFKTNGNTILILFEAD
jgi:hypothetical protein